MCQRFDAIRTAYRAYSELCDMSKAEFMRNGYSKAYKELCGRWMDAWREYESLLTEMKNISDS